MEVVVFGAGSLGSYLGARLATAHEVTLVGRDPHMATVRAQGLTVSGRESFSVEPSTTTDGRNLRADLALVTVKAFDTESATAALATGTFETVCSLQNGMGNEASLSAGLEVPIVAGTASYGAILKAPGEVEVTGHGEVVLGDPEGGSSTTARDVAAAFEAVDLSVTVAADMPCRLWSKLAVNAAINPLTALLRAENGAIATPPVRPLARDTARETARTARACGVTLSNRSALEHLEEVVSATSTNESSMLQDVRANRRTEIDAINGYVHEQARRQDIETPVNALLTELIRGWEVTQNLRNST